MIYLDNIGVIRNKEEILANFNFYLKISVFMELVVLTHNQEHSLKLSPVFTN